MVEMVLTETVEKRDEGKSIPHGVSHYVKVCLACLPSPGLALTANWARQIC